VSASPVPLYDQRPPSLLAAIFDRQYCLVTEFSSSDSQQDRAVAYRTAVYDPQDAFYVPLAGRGIDRPGPDVAVFERCR
jgi:hypothetical protein